MNLKQKMLGILVCKNLDRRTKSALKVIRSKLKKPEDISIII